MTMRVTKFAIPEILFGRGSVQQLVPCARSLGAKTIFLVSDPGIEEAGWLGKIRKLIHGAGLGCVEFCEVNANPRDFQVHKGAELYREVEADVIVALGGGSPMDTAKGIGIVASNGRTIEDYEGANRIERPLPPMIFLPTTAGSGSDLSQFCIITDVARRLKISIISRSLIPNISIIDPDFLTSKSNSLIVDSAIDALAHAIESFTSRATSPFSENQARLALGLWRDNIDDAAANRAPAALENLSLASAAAGMSFSNAGLGIGHALAHALGGRLDMRHGMMHSILLPTVMRYNISSCLPKMLELLRILFPESSFSGEADAFRGIDRLEEHFSALGVPVKLSQILPDKNVLPAVCEAAVNDACMVTNPRPANVEDLLTICEEAWI
jgi:alcohol dehydrogenase